MWGAARGVEGGAGRERRRGHACAPLVTISQPNLLRFNGDGIRLVDAHPAACSESYGQRGSCGRAVTAFTHGHGVRLAPSQTLRAFERACELARQTQWTAAAAAAAEH